MDANVILKLMKMKKFNTTVLIVVLFFITNSLYSQSENLDFSNSKNIGLYLGAQASTSGIGANVSYIFSEKLTVKTGFESLNFNSKINFNENDISYDATLNYTTGGIFVFADYNYTKKLYLSFGGVINSFNPDFKGAATSDMQYGDITIPASKIGDFKFTLSPSLKLSPYFGLGFRNFIGAKKRLVFNFETGLYYIGPPQIDIEATGLLAPTADPAHGQKSNLEKQFESYKIYPVIKINLAVKLF